MIFIDTETCGLHGIAVLIQYAEDEGPIKLHNVWKEFAGETVALLEWFADNELVFFNAAFDWFHIYKLYSIFVNLDPDSIPENHIEEIAILESQARLCPLCLKPKAVMDLMLHSKKGPYQSLMNRKDIRVKRVPNQLCELLQTELEKRVELNGIYFARRKDKNRPQWAIHDNKNKEGEIDPAFKDVVLSFAPSGALKVLAEHVLGEKEILKFRDIEVDKKVHPKELGYAPFALAVGKPGRWNGAWPEVIRHHIIHWSYNRLARKYAEKDVHYTRALYHHFGDPEPGDVDSDLACMVGAVRWRGFRIDIPALKIQRDLAIATKKSTPIAPNAVKAWLQEVMTPQESVVLVKGTGRLILESICGAPGDVGWMEDDKPHPAAIRAQAVIEIGRAHV